MLKSFLSALLVLLASAAWAQFSISGKVQDVTSGRALEGATIQMKERNRAAISDEAGQFRIQNLPPGEYTLVVKFLGYATKTETVSLATDVSISIALEEEATMTDEVIVTATRAGEKTPTTFTNVSREEIQKQNFGQDLPYILNWTPSLVTTSDAGAGVGYTGMRIRGSDGTRINVTINGVPYNDSESMGTFWVDIPDIASSTQSIQVQRGVGTSTNGGAAFGATVNLQTLTKSDEPYAELINSFGSFNTRRHTLGFGTGKMGGQWMMDGRISRIFSDGFIDRASSNLTSYYLSGGYFGEKTMVKALTFGGHERTYQAWYGVPESRLKNDVEAMEVTAMNEGWNELQRQNLLTSRSRTFNPYIYENQVDNYNQDNYQFHVTHRLNTDLTLGAALHYTRGKGYYEEYRYGEDFADYGLPDLVIADDDGVTTDNDTITSTDLIRRRWLDNHFYGFTYSAQYDKDNVNIILGGAWNRYDGDHYGEILWTNTGTMPHEYLYYFNNGDKRDYNLYVKTNLAFNERVNAYLDLQYRGVDYAVEGLENKQYRLDVNENYDFFNPKVGLTVGLTDNQQLYGSYSVANREPVRSDFVDSPDTYPKHETLHDIELGYRKSSSTHMLNVNFYLMSYKNQLVLTGALNDVGAALRTNVDNSHRAGIEIESQLKITNKVSWAANLTLSRNKIDNFTEVLYDYSEDAENYIVENNYSDTDISFSPNVIAGSILSYRPVNGLEIALQSKYVGRQYLDNTSNDNRSIDPYFVNDIRLNYTLRPEFLKEITFSFLVNNVLDEEYSSNGWTYGYLADQEYRENFYYPQAGTNFLAMLTIRF